MIRRIAAGLVCGLLLGAVSAHAQQHATLTLRSGEQINGDLVDLGGIGYTVVVKGVERQVALNDVAIIDFVGGTVSDAEWQKFHGPALVVLRTGETFNGSLYDIAGTSPLRLTMKTADGERQLASTEVARIIMARPDVAAAPVATVGTTPALAFPTEKTSGTAAAAKTPPRKAAPKRRGRGGS